MKIIPIFDDDSCLLTVHYNEYNEDEFARLFKEWTDIEFLEDFFTHNEVDLNNEFWKEFSIENAVLRTRNDAIKLRRKIYQLKNLDPENRIIEFHKFFKPLLNLQTHFDFLEKKKAYGTNGISWIRIYAIKLDNDMFLITGGTIKLTATMDEREHTKKELMKLDRCKEYLKELGLYDKEGMIEYLEIESN